MQPECVLGLYSNCALVIFLAFLVGQHKNLLSLYIKMFDKDC
jgi:hypothetical protein